MLQNVALAGVIVGLTTFLTIHHAWQIKEQFFPTTIFLLRSPLSVAVLTVFTLYLMFLVALLAKTVLFGKLRVIETEHVQEYGWLALSESFLAMTIFRDEFDARFVLIFSAVMLIKAFHWISRDRVDYVLTGMQMEQTPRLARLFHIRMLATITTLGMADIIGLALCIGEVVRNGPSMAILFGNEFALLLVSLMSVTVRYVLNARDARIGTVWEHRSTFLFHYEFFVDLAKLLIYGTFFATVVVYYGIPLHIIRDLYLTIRSFIIRIRDILRYWRATANMEERYPEATAAELAATDRICIVCREEMLSARRLPCGHLFHFRCLRSWLERQQACPTCRRPIIEDMTESRREERRAEPPPPQQPVAQANNNNEVPRAGEEGAAATPMVWMNGRWQLLRNAQTEGEQDPSEDESFNPNLREERWPRQINNNNNHNANANENPGRPALVFPQLTTPPLVPLTPAGQIPGTVIPSPFGTIPVILIPPEQIAPLPGVVAGGAARLADHIPRRAASAEPSHSLHPPSRSSSQPPTLIDEAATRDDNNKKDNDDRSNKPLYMLKGMMPTQPPLILEPFPPASDDNLISDRKASINYCHHQTENRVEMRRTSIRARLNHELSFLTRLQTDISEFTELLVQSQQQLDEGSECPTRDQDITRTVKDEHDPMSRKSDENPK